MYWKRRPVEAYKFGHFSLDLVVRQLLYMGKPLSLPTRTFDILKILVENRGKVVTNEELMIQVWPDRFVEVNNLTVRMSALRKALGESRNRRFIETVPRYGYRFAERVSEVFGESRGVGGAPDSVAVLPLVNENDQQKLNYLCDGITENLIISLSHIANLRVMARNTVFRYKDKKVDARRAGREMGVMAVLTGKVSQSTASLVVEIEMIDVEDGAYLWGAKFKRQMTDLLALQEDIAKEISENLRIKLSNLEESRIGKRHTNNQQAYHLYMKGRYFWNKRSVKGVKRAVEYFRAAIRHDPRYALAYAGIADAYIVLSSYGLRPARETMPKAKAAALKALDMDDRLAEAHVSMGNIKSSYELDWRAAEKEFNLAVGLNPYYTYARQYYANFLAKVGRLDDALAEISEAQEIDPLSLSVKLTMGKIYHFARRHDEAVSMAREILEIEPNFGPANGLIGIAYLAMGRYPDAVREFKAMIRFSTGDYKVGQAEQGESKERRALPDSDPEALALLGYAYAAAGRVERAHEVLGELVELSKMRYVQPHAIALLHIALGDNDKAFEWLEKAFIDKSSTLTFIKVGPFFDNLRADPRYAQLVRRLGLQP